MKNTYKHKGSFDELERIMSSHIGTWSCDEHAPGGPMFVFRDYEGGILNWWKSTGTIQFQGRNPQPMIEHYLDGIRASLPEHDLPSRGPMLRERESRHIAFGSMEPPHIASREPALREMKPKSQPTRLSGPDLDRFISRYFDD